MSYLKSLILSKWVMALTGLVLVGFLIGHTVGNLQMFVGPEVFNSYAAFLQGLGELLWIMRIGLLVCLVLHIITSIRLKLANNAAKPVSYQIKKHLRAKFTSKTMIWTGIMIFAFIVYHLLHFTTGHVHSEYYDYHESVVKEKTGLAGAVVEDMQVPDEIPTVKHNGTTYVLQNEVKVAETRHDVYKMVVLSFRNPLIVIFYVIGVVLLAFHLAHAIQSAFQTLGLNHPKYFNGIILGSNILSFAIAAGLLSIPLSILTGLLGGNI